MKATTRKFFQKKVRAGEFADIDTHLRKSKREVKAWADEDDNESAHAAEDDLRELALMAIAGGHPRPVQVARLGLGTKNLKFKRYTA
jgi:hypothetical protein